MYALLISTLLVWNISILLLFMFSVANLPLTAQILSDQSDFRQYVHDCGYINFRVKHFLTCSYIHVYWNVTSYAPILPTALMMNIWMNEWIWLFYNLTGSTEHARLYSKTHLKRRIINIYNRGCWVFSTDGSWTWGCCDQMWYVWYVHKEAFQGGLYQCSWGGDKHNRLRSLQITRAQVEIVSVQLERGQAQ